MPSFDDVAAGLCMPLAEAMETQRAVRRLRTDPVDDATVLRCIELALHAPTAGNHQDWEWVVVRDPDVKHQLARLNRQAWSISKRLGRRRPHPFSADKIHEAIQWQADHYEETPVVVVACLRGTRFFHAAGDESDGRGLEPLVHGCSQDEATGQLARQRCLFHFPEFGRGNPAARLLRVAGGRSGR